MTGEFIFQMVYAAGIGAAMVWFRSAALDRQPHLHVKDWLTLAVLAVFWPATVPVLVYYERTGRGLDD